MKKILLFALLAVSSLTACDKEDDITPTFPSKEELLVNKSWRLTGLTGTQSIDGKLVTTDYYDREIEAYQRDDSRTFKADKTYVFDRGALKKDPADLQTETGSWAFNSDQTEITLGVKTYGLAELTPTTMVLTDMEDIGSPDEATNRLTFTAF